MVNTCQAKSARTSQQKMTTSIAISKTETRTETILLTDTGPQRHEDSEEVLVAEQTGDTKV